MARLKQWHRKPVAELSIEDGFGVWFERYHKHMQVNGYTEQTLTQKRETIRYFVAWCEERGLEKPYQVTEEVVNRYKHHLHYAPSQTGEPLSVSTQRLRLTSVKVFFRYLMEQRFIEVNPCKTLQLPRVKHKVCRDFLALEEVETVLLEPDLSKPTGIRDRAMMELFFSSGLRRNELTHIGVFDVNMVDRKLNIVEGKGGKQRVIPMTSRACMWLEHYMDGVRPQLDKKLTDRLFLGRYGQPLSNGTVTRSFGQYIKRALPNKKGACHILRHSFATSMLEGDINLRALQELLGHSSLSTTQIYMKTTNKFIEKEFTKAHPFSE